MGRTKLNRTVLQARVDSDTSDKLKQMALSLGFQWGEEGNTGAFLDAIAAIPVEKIKQFMSSSDPLERFCDHIPLNLEQKIDCKTKIINLIRQGKNHFREVENFCDGYTVIEIVKCKNELISENVIKEEGAYYHLK